MKPFLLALATAAAWGIGGYFEKKGLHQSALSPQVGAALRTAVALVVLAFAAGPPGLRQLVAAPPRGLALIGLGGGVAAGALGILCFYAALRSAPIHQVMPVAFTSPVFAALAAVALGGEAISWRAALGIVLTVSGVALVARG